MSLVLVSWGTEDVSSGGLAVPSPPQLQLREAFLPGRVRFHAPWWNSAQCGLLAFLYLSGTWESIWEALC